MTNDPPPGEDDDDGEDTAVDEGTGPEPEPTSDETGELPEQTDGDDGCSCRQGRGSQWGALSLLLLGCGVARRRRFGRPH